jgi:hypothetical protein
MAVCFSQGAAVRVHANGKSICEKGRLAADAARNAINLRVNRIRVKNLCRRRSCKKCKQSNQMKHSFNIPIIFQEVLVLKMECSVNRR